MGSERERDEVEKLASKRLALRGGEEEEEEYPHLILMLFSLSVALSVVLDSKRIALWE